MLTTGALAAAVLVAALGPMLAVAALVGAIGGLLVLRDMRWGFVALLAVIALLPFAALPVRIVFTPTFLDVTLAALYVVWVLRIATHRQEGVRGARLAIPVLLFVATVGFAFANGLRNGMPTFTTVRNVAELGAGDPFLPPGRELGAGRR